MRHEKSTGPSKIHNGRAHTSVATSPGNQIQRQAEPNLAPPQTKTRALRGSTAGSDAGERPGSPGNSSPGRRLQAPQTTRNSPHQTDRGAPPPAGPRTREPRFCGPPAPIRRDADQLGFIGGERLGIFSRLGGGFFSPARAVAEEEMLLLSIAAPPLDGGGF
jgi:hypothetical protein